MHPEHLAKRGLVSALQTQIQKGKRTSDNSCAIKKAEYSNHVWTYDSISDQTEDGGKLKILTLLDEFTRESTASGLGRSILARDVIAAFEYLFLVRGAPKFIRSDNGPEFIADATEKWPKRNNVETLHIAPGSPWENGYIGSFNSKLCYDILDR